jgi:regulatory protein
LLRQGFEADEVEAALERLREQRYIDDRGFAARYARSRLLHHGLGQHRVQQELKRRGVARRTVEAGVAEALADIPEKDVLDRAARQYWKSRERDAPAKRARGLYMYLIRRGFPATLILERFRALWPKHRDLLEGVEPLDVPEE